MPALCRALSNTKTESDKTSAFNKHTTWVGEKGVWGSAEAPPFHLTPQKQASSSSLPPFPPSFLAAVAPCQMGLTAHSCHFHKGSPPSDLGVLKKSPRFGCLYRQAEAQGMFWTSTQYRVEV